MFYLFIHIFTICMTGHPFRSRSGLCGVNMRRYHFNAGEAEKKFVSKELVTIVYFYYLRHIAVSSNRTLMKLSTSKPMVVFAILPQKSLNVRKKNLKGGENYAGIIMKK